MASLVLGTRTADTKNDSVINVSAISALNNSESEAAGPSTGAFGTDSTARAEESLRVGRFAATGPPRRDPARKHGSEVPRGARRGRARPSISTDSN